MGLGDRTWTGQRARVGIGEAAAAAWRERVVVSSEEAGWLAVLPCAVATVAAIVVLGPPLGRLLPRGYVTPWPVMVESFRPEPTEHARYALALLAPLVLAAAIALASRRPLRAPRGFVGLIPYVQVLGLVFLVVCIVEQRRARVEAAYTEIPGTSPRTVYFTLTTLAVAVALAVALTAIVRNSRARARAHALLRDTRSRRALAWSLATVAVAVALLPAIQLEDTVLNANANTSYHLMFTYDETSAVLNGRSPLVDFAAQYASLWPYLLAGAMSLVGTSVGAFAALTTSLTAVALLAVFATLRRVVGSATAALLLFLPLLATSLYKMNGSLLNRFSLATLTGMYPLRLAGPCMLLWLTARQLDRSHDGRDPRRWPLLAFAGLVVLNNVEFGLPACLATCAALLWARPPSRRELARLTLELAAGLAAALALVSVLTLIRAGTLPHLGLVVRYADLFAGSGFGMLPLVPTIGISTAIFLTYVGAIGTASARAVAGAPDRLLTGLLAWSGVFGLGVGTYYVGRSHPEVLTNMFPAWALSIVLLLVVALRAVASRRPRLPSPAELAVFVGFGVLVCSLAQTPAPWAQVARLRTTTAQRIVAPSDVRFVTEHVRRGEAVAILLTIGHRLAAMADVVDVTPYTGLESMPTREQLWETLNALRRAGGHTVIVTVRRQTVEVVEAVQASGYRNTVTGDGGNLVALSDR